MEKRGLLYEGKAKKVFGTDNEDILIVDYKDDATAFNGLKKGSICGKGAINNKMSNLICKMLERNEIPTHYIEELSERETAVKKVKIVPLEVIVRNRAAGSMAKRLGLEEGQKLLCPVLEFSYKNDALGDPMINSSHALACGFASKEEIELIEKLALKINALLIDYFSKINIELIDFKLEFGKHKGEIILADEISPDTCRFWDMTTGEKLDKDRFRRDLGGVEEAYEEIAARLGL